MYIFFIYKFHCSFSYALTLCFFYWFGFLFTSYNGKHFVLLQKLLSFKSNFLLLEKLAHIAQLNEIKMKE